MKTKEISAAYHVLGDAKLSSMEDADKYKVIKAIRRMKAVSDAYEDFVKDARERLKPENHEEMMKKAEQWQREGDKTTLTMDERVELNRFFAAYNRSVEACVLEEAEKEHALCYARLSEEAFGKLMASNPGWDVKSILCVESALVEETEKEA